MPFSPRHVLIASILNPLLSYNLQQQNSYKTCLWLLSSPSFTHALLKPIQLGFSPSHLIEIAHGKDTIGLHSAKLSSCISIWNNCLFERIHHFLFTERRLVFFCLFVYFRDTMVWFSAYLTDHNRLVCWFLIIF
jgi:hypothetical protein